MLLLGDVAHVDVKEFSRTGPSLSQPLPGDIQKILREIYPGQPLEAGSVKCQQVTAGAATKIEEGKMAGRLDQGADLVHVLFGFLLIAMGVAI